MSGTPPLVGVVTPVYNGGRYLAECIESVQAQSYPHWRYTIVDNRSTDETNVIANRYAAADPRIRVVQNEEFLPMLANWNAAMHEADPESAYIKVLHADDMLFPECLSQMVALAEEHPQVGIVGAYRLSSDTVELNGLDYPSPVVSGREICRRSLLSGLRVFGSPSSLLLRANLVWAKQRFYNEANLHADTEVCYELLQHCDYGFIHQVLTYTRRHPEQMTTFAQRQNSFLLAHLSIALCYGPVYLTPEELDRKRAQLLANYYRFLARNLARRDPRFWSYHRDSLRAFGLQLESQRLVIAALLEFADIVLNPKRTLERVLKKTRRIVQQNSSLRGSLTQRKGVS